MVHGTPKKHEKIVKGNNSNTNNHGIISSIYFELFPEQADCKDHGITPKSIADFV